MRENIKKAYLYFMKEYEGHDLLMEISPRMFAYGFFVGAGLPLQDARELAYEVETED
jgi:hypothetical protein